MDQSGNIITQFLILMARSRAWVLRTSPRTPAVTGYLRHSIITAVCTATFLTSAICQQGVAKASAQVRAGREVVSRLPMDILAQLSGSLQQLARKVSPAVVQIEVSGYGPADSSARLETDELRIG